MDFAAEDKSAGDTAREDIWGLIRGDPKVPQEAKRQYAVAGRGGGTGIQKNKAGLAKASEVIQPCFGYGRHALGMLGELPGDPLPTTMSDKD